MQIVPEYVPQAFGGLLLTFALILTLAPYISGYDFGVFKIPTFDELLRKKLRKIGPLALLSALIIHLPFGEKLCEEPIFELVADKQLCGTSREEYTIAAARPKTCRHPDFGQVGWRSADTKEKTSNWMGGGHGKKEWCDSVLKSFLTSRSIKTGYTHQVLEKDESSKKDLAGRVTYQYSCKIKVQWDPIFEERSDERCGMWPAETGWREVPAQCQKQVGVRKVPCTGQKA